MPPSTQSLFAWSFARRTIENIVQEDPELEPNDVASTDESGSEERELKQSFYGMFASSPQLFKGCNNIVFCSRGSETSHLGIVHGKLKMQMPVAYLPANMDLDNGNNISSLKIGFLACGLTDAPHCMVGILLCGDEDTKKRVGPGSSTYTFLVPYDIAFHASIQEVLIGTTLQHIQERFALRTWQCSILVKFAALKSKQFNFTGVRPATWTWNEAEATFILKDATRSTQSLICGFYNTRRKELLCVYLHLNQGIANKEDGIKLCYIPATEDSAHTVLNQAFDDEITAKMRYITLATRVQHDDFTAWSEYRPVLHHSIHVLEIRDSLDPTLPDCLRQSQLRKSLNI